MRPSARVRRAGDHLGGVARAAVEVQPPQAHDADHRGPKRADLRPGHRRLEQPGQGRADDDDRLAQGDEDERLAPFGQMAAFDRPLRGGRAAQARRIEAHHAAEQVHGHRGEPQPVPGRPGHDPAGHGERATDQAPGQDPLEVRLERLSPQHGNHEDAAPDLHHRVGAPDDQAEPAERRRQGGRHRQRHQPQGEQEQPDRDALGIQPVGHPRGVRPGQPHHGQEHGRLYRAGHRGPA